jgi:hypothetical protein
VKYLVAALLLPLLVIPVFAQTNSQVLPTEKGTLNIKLSYDEIVPGDQTKLLIEFINPQTNEIQNHVDYRLSISKDGESVWGPIPLTHTSEGVVKGLKVEFPKEGTYVVEFQIEGILFHPIPAEKASFDVVVGKSSIKAVPPTPANNKGGGCLIATAAYGTELAPQVQLLREIRDNTVMSTASGMTFMTGFNQLYYSFSPTIADLERESPVFQQAVRAFITPMISTLSIMTLAENGSESQVLGLGMTVIVLNLGMYIGIPIFGILKFNQFKKNRHLNC